MLMAGLVTLDTSCVGSVTSTCLRSNLGDMRTYSAPMVPGSSGALSGHRSSTSGLSAACAGAATNPPMRKTNVAALRFMVISPFLSLLRFFLQRLVQGDLPPQTHFKVGEARYVFRHGRRFTQLFAEHELVV